MTQWHTPERVIELLRHCEARGINTWQNSYAERTLSDLERYRESSGKMKILLEANAVERLTDAHIKQVLNYLAASICIHS